MNILVVEDDERVARFLVRGLKEEGFNVELCSDGHTALETGLTQTYQVILLDWSLPDMDGLTVLERWRELGVISPVIMITARTGIDNTVLGLDHGADDYIEKPFSFEELLARIRANIRRHQLSGGKSGSNRTLKLGDALLDMEARTIQLCRQSFTLSNREYHLLSFLLKNRGEVVSRSRILDRVWGMSHDPTTNVVDVYIRYLRDKLDSSENRAAGRSVIETVRGRGYRLKSEA
ncbi:MAG: response regulator transcription factor [Acidobacteriota bacterium]|nr:response regulator transcription factor [Acidobacteriota bacterium]